MRTPSRRTTLWCLPAVFSLIVLTACTNSGPQIKPDTTRPDTSPTSTATTLGDDKNKPVRDLITGLDVPWSVAFYGQTPLVSERDKARIVELLPRTDGTYTSREVAIIKNAAPRGEGGLLGLAVQGKYLYAYVTTRQDNRIERFAVHGKPGSLSLGPATTILKGIPRSTNHNGGRIAFGPDGKLYATTGDAGTPKLAQDRASLGGKILRMEPNGAVPKDNPFKGSLVYSYGHRNPQGIAWYDDDKMYASEFGQNTWDELNVITPGGNYGWPVVEGIAKKSEFIDPVQQWSPVDASPSGIAVANGSIFIASLRGQRLREVPLTDLSVSWVHFVNEYGRLRAAINAPDGSMWLLTNNTDGRVKPRPGDDRILRVAFAH